MFTLLHRASMAPSTAALTVTTPRSPTRTATTRALEGRDPATTPTKSEGAVHVYGQLLRAALEPGALMAIATYPPQSLPGATYPFASAALSWDVIVPMDYWHAQRRAYSPAEVFAFVRDSVIQIRAHAAGHAGRGARPDGSRSGRGATRRPAAGG